jgi:hypothetical protein
MCPVELTDDVSASEKRSWNVKLGVGTQANVFELRNGADDETTRRAIEGDGEEDQLVGCGGDHRSDGPDYAVMA